MWAIPKISGAVREALTQCRAHFYTIGILSALINILYLAPSIYMLQVYDRVLPTGGLLTLFWITLFTTFLLLVLAIFDAIRMRVRQGRPERSQGRCPSHPFLNGDRRAGTRVNA